MIGLTRESQREAPGSAHWYRSREIVHQAAKHFLAGKIDRATFEEVIFRYGGGEEIRDIVRRRFLEALTRSERKIG